MKKTAGNNGLVFNGQFVNLLALILGVAAAYFLTIQSLKIELAAKAENTAVDKLDKKLANIEVILKETVLGKGQFYDFANRIETRLGRIEYFLIDQSGDEIENSKRQP